MMTIAIRNIRLWRIFVKLLSYHRVAIVRSIKEIPSHVKILV